MGADSKLGTDFFRYRGRSMWPAFQNGDLLEVQPLTLQELCVGDCITYRLNDCETLVTHRIITIHDGSIRTRGDALPWADDLSVNASQLVGQVIGCFRLGCLNQVRGGKQGRLLGGFYHYAGRLDPQRDARGGRIARLLRSSLQWLAAELYRRGTMLEFGCIDKGLSHYWHVGQRPWASFDHSQGYWQVPWPQSLLIDPNRLPDLNQAKA
jgi:hypothetical protein